MADPFVAEIRIVSFNFPPKGWAHCDGQLMPISQNTALFSLLGTFYGGDGKSNFALPDLQGRAPLHAGQGPGLTDRFVGEAGGQASVTLLTSEIPQHSHSVTADAVAAGQASPANNTWGKMAGRTPPPLYRSGAASGEMNPIAFGPTGSSAPHNNMSPYLVLNFVISLQGVFPPRG